MTANINNLHQVIQSYHQVVLNHYRKENLLIFHDPGLQSQRLLLIFVQQFLQAAAVTAHQSMKQVFLICAEESIKVFECLIAQSFPMVQYLYKHNGRSRSWWFEIVSYKRYLTRFTDDNTTDAECAGARYLLFDEAHRLCDGTSAEGLLARGLAALNFTDFFTTTILCTHRPVVSGPNNFNNLACMLLKQAKLEPRVLLSNIPLGRISYLRTHINADPELRNLEPAVQSEHPELKMNTQQYQTYCAVEEANPQGTLTLELYYSVLYRAFANCSLAPDNTPLAIKIEFIIQYLHAQKDGNIIIYSIHAANDFPILCKALDQHQIKFNQLIHTTAVSERQRIITEYNHTAVSSLLLLGDLDNDVITLKHTNTLIFLNKAKNPPINFLLLKTLANCSSHLPQSVMNYIDLIVDTPVPEHSSIDRRVEESCDKNLKLYNMHDKAIYHRSIEYHYNL